MISMHKQEILFDMNKLQKQAAYLTFGLMLAASFVYFLIHGMEIYITLTGCAVFFLLTGLGIVLHEFLHGIGFICFGKVRLKEVKYGILWKQGVAYAHCQVPIKLRAYRIALLLPVILTGLIPLLIAYIIGNGMLLTVSVILTAGGIGDWLVFRSLMKYDASQRVLDHPTKVGYFIYTNTSEDKEKTT
jgi:Putative zincin peptidase